MHPALAGSGRQAVRQLSLNFKPNRGAGKPMDWHQSRRNRGFKSNACFLFIKFGLPLKSEVLDGVGPLRMTVKKFQEYVSSFVHLYLILSIGGCVTGCA